MLYLCEAQAPVRYWSLMPAATSYLELSHAEQQPIVELQDQIKKWEVVHCFSSTLLDPTCLCSTS